MPIFRRRAQGNTEAFPYRGDKSNLPGWAAEWEGPPKEEVPPEGLWVVFEEGEIKTVKGDEFERDYELYSPFSG